MKLLVVVLICLCAGPAQAQVTGGERYYENYSEHWRDEQRPYERQRERRLDRNKLGGPPGSRSDYVYGTRERRYERDDGGRGSNYSRDGYYRDDGY